MQRSNDGNDSIPRIKHTCIISSHTTQCTGKANKYIKDIQHIFHTCIYFIEVSKRMIRNTNEYSMYFNHVQCSRRFCLVTCTLPSYQPTVFRNFLLPVSPRSPYPPPGENKRFSYYSQGNNGSHAQPMPCQDPTYLSMP